jgi:hypothetical protein
MSSNKSVMMGELSNEQQKWKKENHITYARCGILA